MRIYLGFIVYLLSVIGAISSIFIIKGCGQKEKTETVVIAQNTCDNIPLGETKTVACGEGYLGNKVYICQNNGWKHFSGECTKAPTTCQEENKGKTNFIVHVIPVAEKHCKKCHYSAKDNLLSYDIVKSKIKQIRKRIGATDATRMPPDYPLEDAEIQVFEQWERDGFIEKDECIDKDPYGNPKVFLDEKHIESHILKDLQYQQERNEGNRRNYFYLSIAHKYNEGATSLELDTYKKALWKGINSLSRRTQIINPVALDPQQTVYRIDLNFFGFQQVRNYPTGPGPYGEQKKAWERIVTRSRNDPNYPPIPRTKKGDVIDMVIDASPFVYESETDEGILIKTLTGRDINWMNGADFLFVSLATARIYYETLGVGNNLDEYLAQIGVDFQGCLDNFEANFIGLDNGPISLNKNRLLVSCNTNRSELGRDNGYFNQTYDPLDPKEIRERNLFEFMFLNGTGSDRIFDFLASEAISELPNGLHLYTLWLNDGTRLEEADPALVSDINNPFGERVIEVALDCLRCHKGLIPAVDKIRAHCLRGDNPADLNTEDIERCQNFYKDAVANNAYFIRANDRYKEALAAMKISISDPDPINIYTDDHLSNWDLKHFCGFFHQEPSVCELKIQRSDILKGIVGAILTEGTTISNDQIVRGIEDIKKELRLGLDPLND